MARLFLLMTIVPVVELYLLIQIGNRVGPIPTVAMVVLTGMLGAALARREGLKVFQQWQQSLRMGVPPADGVVNGALVLLGGVLLVTPGVLTDILGLLLLIPASRRVFARWTRRAIDRRIARATGHFGSARGGSDRARASAGRTAFRRDGESEAEIVDAREPERS